MSPRRGTRTPIREGPGDQDGQERVRLAHAERRDALLATAVGLLAESGPEAVTMEGVAERAGVSRPLVYKHFADRHDVLAALYQREATLLHYEIAAEVTAAARLEDKFRALMHGLLRAQASRGATLAALQAAGGRDESVVEKQRRRNQGTHVYFAAAAVAEFGLSPRRANAAVGILLGAIPQVLQQWRSQPTPERAALLEDTYVELVAAGLGGMASR
jgi:AcrR family transcriptional regulator